MGKLHRRSVLFMALVTAVLAQSGETQERKPYQHTSLLLVKRINEAGPLIKELSKLPGVERVVASNKTKTLTITFKKDSPPAPADIWETAVRLKAEPVRLVTAMGVYTSKPER